MGRSTRTPGDWLPDSAASPGKSAEPFLAQRSGSKAESEGDPGSIATREDVGRKVESTFAAEGTRMMSVGARVVSRGAGKEIDGIALVPAVDLVAEPGECVVVRGPNGSGKTTLLSMVAGRLEPTTGTVTVDGVTADERDPSQRARVAVLLGAPALYRDMTLIDHLTLIDATWGREPTTCEDRVQAALKELGLSGLASRFPHELSSGQTQLFRLAVTLFRPGDLLILDEPEQRLDTDWRTRVAEVLRRRSQDGTTLVLASHDLVMTESVADKIVDLKAQVS